ncbi:MAG: chromate efflux transporter [Candidatus Carbobacillus altaicus]|nr:chromate efflux transporter [Candidatus Carbobacillus altaicus]
MLKRLKGGWDIFYTALILGLTSFGGPTAHFGYFYRTYIEKKKWIEPDTYADLIALANFLPGPASSQVGMSIGLLRGGLHGGFLAWLGFTLPSATIMALFAWFLQNSQTMMDYDAFWLHGLKLLAVAIVLQAVQGMAKKLSTGRLRATITVLTAILVLLSNAPGTQAALIIMGGLFTLFFEHKGRREDSDKEGHEDDKAISHDTGNMRISGIRTEKRPFVSKRTGWVLLVIFFVLCMLVWLASSLAYALIPAPTQTYVELFSKFFLTGSMVFGGGHVVLPLLEKDVVQTKWVSPDQFLAGYGLAQGLPGPLFTFAAYLGMLIAGWPGAILALIAIFLPGMLLMAGAYPFWHSLKKYHVFQKIMSGVGAAVVGLLLAALYDPLWTQTVTDVYDVSIVGLLWLLLHVWHRPPLMVLIISLMLAWIKVLLIL